MSGVDELVRLSRLRASAVDHWPAPNSIHLREQVSNPVQNANVKGFPACAQQLPAATSKAASRDSSLSVSSSENTRSISDSLIVLILSFTYSGIAETPILQSDVERPSRMTSLIPTPHISLPALTNANRPYRCEASPNRSAQPRLDGTL